VRDGCAAGSAVAARLRDAARVVRGVARGRGYRVTANRIIGCGLVSLLLAACATPVNVPRGEPFVIGPLESITGGSSGPTLLVRAGPGSHEACGISARTDPRTTFLRRAPHGDMRTATPAEPLVGDTVEIYVSGPVAESCPTQGYAATVVLRR
jgi:hypothetical protein